MNKMMKLLGLAFILLAAGLASAAQESAPERVVVPLSNPGKPALVKAETMRGSITVKGYEGKDVIVEAQVREKAIMEKKAAEERVPGMKLIQVGTTGLTIEESANVVDIEVESMKRTVDLVIQVPYATSLNLEIMMGGQLSVENVSGEIEVENMNGPISIQGVSGTVLADSMNGEVKVAFAKVNPDKPMSFTTMNGAIDITLPADIKATLKLKSEMGNIYSDFDLVLKETRERKEVDERKEGGKYKLTFERTITGTINGGGVELRFETFQGDIFIRKAK